MNRLTFNDLCKINKRICNLFNEESIIINENNIKSALSAFDSYYNTNESIASALFRNIITAHGFKDANKRTALIALYLCLPPRCNVTDVEELAIRTAKDTSIDLNIICNTLYNRDIDESLNEDTNKKSNGKWVNKGKDGEHGEFKTKKEADAQRKAMYANGYHESLENDDKLTISEFIEKYDK